MNEKRLQEIIERKAAIKTEMDKADVEQLRKLSDEADALIAEEKQIRSKMDLFGKLGDTVSKPEDRSVASEAEKRGRDLMQNRAVTVATEGVLLPQHTSKDVKPGFNEVSSIVDRVDVMPLPGGESFKQAYMKNYGEGEYTAEGAAYNETVPNFGYAEIKKTKITAYSEVTEEVVKLPAANYEEVVMRGVPVAIRKKLAKEILIGNGESGHLTGIFDDGATAIDPATDLSLKAIDEHTLDEIIYSFGGDEDVEDTAVLILSKADLKAFTKVRGSDKKKVYDIKPNGNTGTIDGVPYIIASACKPLSVDTTAAQSYCMAYGPLKNYTLGVFSEMEIMRSTDYKFKEGMIAHKGSVFVGGNVTTHNGFIRVKKSA